MKPIENRPRECYNSGTVGGGWSYTNQQPWGRDRRQVVVVGGFLPF